MKLKSFNKNLMEKIIEKPVWSDSFGVKKIKNLFSNNEINEISDNVKVLEEEKDRKNYIWKFYEKKIKRINRIEYFIKFNKFFLI